MLLLLSVCLRFVLFIFQAHLTSITYLSRMRPLVCWLQLQPRAQNHRGWWKSRCKQNEWKAANKSTNTIFVRLCWTISAESITKNAVVSYYRSGLGRASDAELSKTEQWRVEKFSQHWFVTFPLGIFFISVSERYTIKWNINVHWLRNKTQNNNVQIRAQAHAHTSSPMISPINNNWAFPSLYYLDAM